MNRPETVRTLRHAFQEYYAAERNYDRMERRAASTTGEMEAASDRVTDARMAYVRTRLTATRSEITEALS